MAVALTSATMLVGVLMVRGEAARKRTDAALAASENGIRLAVIQFD